MRTTLLLILLYSATTLFANDSNLQKDKEYPDEIEILVNDLLADKGIEKVTDIPLTSHKETTMRKNGKYFIQMFAFSKSKPKKIIEKIRKKGYKTDILQTVKDGKKINRLLAGPFKNMASAKKALKLLKNIEREAFIYKIK